MLAINLSIPNVMVDVGRPVLFIINSDTYALCVMSNQHTGVAAVVKIS